MNIMLCAGFGKAYDFEHNPSASSKEEGTMDFRQANGDYPQEFGIGPQNLPKLAILSKRMETLARVLSTFDGIWWTRLSRDVRRAKKAREEGTCLGL